ncbi:MAG: hypothetical protein ACAI25_12720 [Planctomycetota bacterium]
MGGPPPRRSGTAPFAVPRGPVSGFGGEAPKRAPAWVLAAALGTGVLAVFLPILWPELLGPWSGSRLAFAAAAGAAVVIHEALHHAFHGKLAPGVLVALAAGAVMAYSLPIGWSAFAANLAATIPDAWEAIFEGRGE